MLTKIKELWGVIRRFYLVHCRPEYVETKRKQRVGECSRCGDCCLLVVRCPFLEGKNECKIYSKRSEQCRMFPIDERDLEDCPTCSFRFVEDARSTSADTG